MEYEPRKRIKRKSGRITSAVKATPVEVCVSQPRPTRVGEDRFPFRDLVEAEPAKRVGNGAQSRLEGPSFFITATDSQISSLLGVAQAKYAPAKFSRRKETCEVEGKVYSGFRIFRVA